MTPLRPHLMVLFGGTGDLARRKLLPGLFHLSQAGLLPECRILNTSLDPLDDAGFRAHARSAIDEFERGGFPDAVWDSAAGATMSGSPKRTSTEVRRTRGSATSVDHPHWAVLVGRRGGQAQAVFAVHLPIARRGGAQPVAHRFAPAMKSTRIRASSGPLSSCKK